MKLTRESRSRRTTRSKVRNSFRIQQSIVIGAYVVGKRPWMALFAYTELIIVSCKEYLKNTHNTCYHACGTASMLPRDKNGVVDPKLKVRCCVRCIHDADGSPGLCRSMALPISVSPISPSHRLRLLHTPKRQFMV